MTPSTGITGAMPTTDLPDHVRVAVLGDVAGIEPFTHTANYQGWVAAQNLLRRPTTTDHSGIPRTVYTAPELAAVGMTRAEAEEAGHDVVHVVFDLADTARGSVDPADAGRLVLVADRSSRLLLGASLVAPAAGESISEFALAIRAEIGVDLLAELVHPFPTWSEGFGYACLLYTSPSPRDLSTSRMPSSA